MVEFTETCDKSYDRHNYAIVFPDGREQLFCDYETMRYFWFAHSKISKMTVRVDDVPVSSNAKQAVSKDSSRKLGFV